MNETQHNLYQFEAKSLTGCTVCDISKNVSVWVSKGLGLERKSLIYIPARKTPRLYITPVLVIRRSTATFSCPLSKKESK